MTSGRSTDVSGLYLAYRTIRDAAAACMLDERILAGETLAALALVTQELATVTLQVLDASAEEGEQPHGTA